jgi:hypothetical protein
VSYILVGTDFLGSGVLFLEWLIVLSQNPQATLADLATMLLSNLSVSASVTSALISMKIPIIPDRKDPELFYAVQSRSGTSPLPPPGDSTEVLAMPLLVDAFIQGALVDENQKLDERKRKGELHFLASIFANITTVGSVDQTTPKLGTDSYAVANWPNLLFDAISFETAAARFAYGVPIGETDRVHGTQGQDQERRRLLHHQVSGRFIFQE